MKTRTLNGYRIVYEPEHPRAMRSRNWNGYVYEHIKVAESTLDRPLMDDEEVHHLDLDRANNRPENLLVLRSSQHRKLHNWLNNGAPGLKESGANGVNSRKPKLLYCRVCNKLLNARQTEYCSRRCISLRPEQRKVPRPSKEDLVADIESMSWEAMGRKYAVSGNAVRKWARNYGLVGNLEPSAEYTQ